MPVMRLEAYRDMAALIDTRVARMLNVFKHEQFHVFSIGLGVHKNVREQDKQFFVPLGKP